MPLEKAKDAADEDRLRSLGYVASGRAAPVSPPPVEPKKEASEAREAGFTAPPSQAEEARPADSVAAGRRADVETEPGAAPRQRQSTPSGRPSSASAEGTAVLTPADLHYRALLRTRPTTAEGARSLQRAWNAFARSSTAGRWADEARVRAVEAGAAAYRFSGAPADRTAVEEDAAAYLGRSDAEQKARVRALLNDLDR
jgi:hypothetical protein